MTEKDELIKIREALEKIVLELQVMNASHALNTQHDSFDPLQHLPLSLRYPLGPPPVGDNFLSKPPIPEYRTLEGNIGNEGDIPDYEKVYVDKEELQKYNKIIKKRMLLGEQEPEFPGDEYEPMTVYKRKTPAEPIEHTHNNAKVDQDNTKEE